MDTWSVTSSYDTSEETFNFGTRNLAESNDLLYESVTLATIQATQEIPENSNIITLSKSDFLCCVVDQHIKIFTSSVSSLENQLTTDSPIDCYYISENKEYILVCCKNGNIKCLKIDGHVLFAVAIEKSNEEYKNTFVSVNLENQHDELTTFIVVSRSGCIYRLTIKNLKQSLLSNEELLVSHDTIKKYRTPLSAANYVQFTYGDLLLVAGKELYKVDLQDSDERLSPSIYLNSILPQIKKIYTMKKDFLSLFLTGNGNLGVICTLTLQYMIIWDKAEILDFQFFEESETSNIILLTKSEQDTYIQFFSYPDFNLNYKLKVTNKIFLINTSKKTDDFIYIEGICKTSSGFIDTFLVKCVTEANVELRLEKLLLKHRFDEAEDFAKKFGLNLISVYKAKARHLVDLLNHPLKDKVKCRLDSVNQLIVFFDEINDPEFMIDCCNNIIHNDFTEKRILLEYSFKFIRNALLKNPNSEKLLQIQKSIYETHLRLETYELMVHYEQNTSLDFEGWLKFSKIDLYNSIKRFLKTENYPLASLIWLRHHYFIVKNHSPSIAIKLLNSIPEDAQPQEIFPWLHNFISVALKEYPVIFQDIIQFIINKTRSLEDYAPQEWPENSIDFAEQMLTLLNTKEDGKDADQDNFLITSFQQQFLNKDSPLQNLLFIIKCLKELCILKQEHSIYMSLSDYTKDSEKVFNIILDKVHPQYLDNILPFLEKYILDRRLVKDEIFYHYIFGIISVSSNLYDQTEALWESRVLLLIKHVHDMNIRLTIIDRVLCAAPVPWTVNIQTLAEKSISLKHPLCQKIKEHISNIDLKLLFKKYNFKSDFYKTDFIQWYQLINRIISIDKPELMDDLNVIINRQESLKKYVYNILVQTYINKGKSSETLNILKALQPKDLIECGNFIVSILKRNLELKYINPFLCNYIEILDRLLLLVKKARQVLELQNQCEDEVMKLKNIYFLRAEFNIFICYDTYKSDEERMNCLKLNIDKLYSEAVTGDNIKNDNVLKLCTRICRLTTLLDFPREQGLDILMGVNDNEHVAIFIARYVSVIVHKNETNEFSNEEVTRFSKILYNFALKCLLFKLNRNLNNDFDLDCNIDFTSIEMSDIALKILKYICAYDADPVYGEVLTWSIIINDFLHSYLPQLSKKHDIPDFIKDSCIVSRLRIVPMYRDMPVGLNFATALAFLRNLLNCVLKLIDESDLFEKHFNEDQSSFDESYISSCLSAIPNLLRILHVGQHNLTTLRVTVALKKILFYLNSSENKVVCEQINSFSKSNDQWVMKSAEVLLKKIVISRKLDCRLAIMSLKTMRDPYQWINLELKNNQGDIPKLTAISTISINFCKRSEDKESVTRLHNILQLCDWANIFKSLGLPPKVIFTEDKKSLLKYLLHNQNVNLTLLKKACKDFIVDEEQTLLFHLDNVLLSWQPEIEVKSSAFGKKELIVASSITELQKRCSDIVSSIERKESVISSLQTIWKKVNFYHYEVFICILNLLSNLGYELPNQNDKWLLLFFMKYLRNVKPQQFETEKWNSEFPDSPHLPEISNWRLPFWSSDNEKSRWKIIRSEVNLDTYEDWIRIAFILNVKEDIIYTYAIRETTRQETIHLKPLVTNKDFNTGEWYIHPRFSELFERIKVCINKITDLEMASSILYQIANSMPPGVDRLNAIYHCYLYSKKWSEQGNEHCSEEKIRKKYLMNQCLHVLHTNGLGSMANYVDDPRELIIALYKHPSIIERVKSTIFCPDINKITEEISNIYNFDINDIRLELIEEWLLQSNEDKKPMFDFDDTFYGNNSFVNSNNSNANLNKFDDNLIRACYILQANNSINSSLKYLFKIGIESNNFTDKTVIIGTNNETFMSGNELQYSLATSLRALRCAIYIANRQQIEEVSCMTYNEVLKYVRTLWFQTKLELLGVPVSVEMLEKNKEKLLQNLWLAHSSHSTALPLIAELLLDSGIQESKLWDNLLEQMIKFSMINTLKYLLPRLHGYISLSFSNSFINAWQLIIQTSFIQASKPIKEAEEKVCIEALFLLQMCPVASSLKLQPLIEECIRIDRKDLAVPFLMYLRDDLIKAKIISNDEAFIENVSRLLNLGISSVSLVMN